MTNESEQDPAMDFVRLLDEQIAKCSSRAEAFELQRTRKKAMDAIAHREALKCPPLIIETAGFFPVKTPLDERTCPELSPAPPHVQAEIERRLDEIFGKHEAKVEEAMKRIKGYEPPVRAPRRHKIVRVSMSSIAMLMTCFAFSNTFRFEMDLPQGARMVRWFPDPIGDCLCMIFEHESFDDVPDGEEIPEAAPGSFRAWP